MHFTRTELKNKKPVNYGTNKMGQYYNNIQVPIKNYNKTPIATRIDKNMNNLNVSDQQTNKKLNQFIQPILNLKPIPQPETNINIFNHNYDDITIKPSLAEKTKNYEDKYEEMKLLSNKPNNISTTMNLKTDDKHFNSFVNVLTEVNENDNDNMDDEYINKPYTKSQITSILKILQLTNITIENVYQETYNANINATGLGDFIRGSYFLMQFCQETNLLFKINMLNHPISKFLEIYQNKQPSNYKNINKFDLTNFNPGILDDNILTNIHDHTINNDFMYFLKDQPVYSKNIYTYIISYPTIIIDEEHKKYMQHLLKPTKYLSLLVNEQLTKLELIEKEFTVIHVRYGDNYLIKNEADINLNHLNTIKLTIEHLDPNQNILLISDNMIIKNIFTKKYPHVKTHFNEITHTGEGIQLDTNKLKNTMIDFYLFSRAQKVFAFSVYKHGTGFSKWAAETYSVPYICRFLQ
jgi:hypothetical protein